MTAPGHRLPPGVAATPVLDEPVHLFTGPGHPYADAPAIAPAHLAGHRIWMPGNGPGNRVDRLLRGAGGGFRLRRRHGRAGLRHRAAARHHRRVHGPGRLRQPADTAGLAGRARAAPHPPGEPDPGLPPLPDLAPRQPPTRPWPPCGTVSPPPVPSGPRVASGFGSGAGHGPGMTVPVRRRVRGRCSGRAFPGAGARFAYDRRDCWDR
ncbi:LysR substrate-binding domain-containing protein [Streptomyces sp. CNQ431]|uniref:LysR substrate-binding domain-containing protein n=1 Tax=Streptomyces sp. CNQ431 TaxID=1571532 RepID=UPI00099C5B1C